MHHHILIVEDEIDLAQLMRDYLLREDYQVNMMHTGSGVVEYVQHNDVDLILLDLMLPGIDGLDICKSIRAFSQIPIIMTTARVDEIDRIIGLEIGADDYVCKPYSPREVVARVKVQLRRIEPNTNGNSSFALDEDSLNLVIGQQHVELTSVEFNLLEQLLNKPGRIYSRDQLMNAAYNDDRIVSDRTIDSHIKKIRQKIKQLEPEREYIHSIYGRGYKYDPRI
ncbi:response regulator [Marinicella sp. W31]|uniref:response regulator n=1 Tax=Marinicella sp. W31 TaxID=3023713 RepID=UPI0037567AEE